MPTTLPTLGDFAKRFMQTVQSAPWKPIGIVAGIIAFTIVAVVYCVWVIRTGPFYKAWRAQRAKQPRKPRRWSTGQRQLRRAITRERDFPLSVSHLLRSLANFRLEDEDRDAFRVAASFVEDDVIEILILTRNELKNAWATLTLQLNPSGFWGVFRYEHADALMAFLQFQGVHLRDNRVELEANIQPRVRTGFSHHR